MGSFLFDSEPLAEAMNIAAWDTFHEISNELGQRGADFELISPIHGILGEHKPPSDSSS